MTKLFALTRLGLLLSEKQIPQVVENLGRGNESKEPLEWMSLLVRQARMPRRPDPAEFNRPLTRAGPKEWARQTNPPAFRASELVRSARDFAIATIQPGVQT